MNSDWARPLKQQTEREVVKMSSMFEKIRSSRVKLESQFCKTIEQIGANEEARNLPPDSTFHEKVLDSIQHGQFEQFSIREQRYAAKQFENISANAMQAFLAFRPANWRIFATECFRRWTGFEQHPDRKQYAQLICMAPASVKFLYVTGRPQDLLATDGPLRVARLLGPGDLSLARNLLWGLGYEPAWGFTALTLARWLVLQVQHSLLGFSAIWDSLNQDLELEAMLLPAAKRQGRSWFSRGQRPARVKGNVTASALCVSALLQTATTDQAASRNWNEFTEGLLQSEFGDPRMPPESDGWRTLRRIDEKNYFRLLELLVSEDLTVFFQHAMQEESRKDFWLRYVKSVRRTVCILDRRKYRELATLLGGAEKKLSAAISRARKFAGSSEGAFCLYFENIVVVEFAVLGNAAYVYERQVFEQHFQEMVDGNKCRNHSTLKKDLAIFRIFHSANWEENARYQLEQFGVVCEE